MNNLEVTRLPTLLEILKLRRKAGTSSHRTFCERYLEPVFGEPDAAGNYVGIVGKSPCIVFTAHHDTVHSGVGEQGLRVRGNFVWSKGGDCLGADCGTGIWLILCMINAGVPGVYVVHAEEESGCIGSEAFVKANEHWLQRMDACISFDRKGYEDIITHQMSMRTASDAFARSLGAILGLGMLPDDGGSFTDSNSYEKVVPECTNVSVGYFSQHTANECQDIEFAYNLADALSKADWTALKIERDPAVVEYADHGYYGIGYRHGGYQRGWEDRTHDDACDDWDAWDRRISREERRTRSTSGHFQDIVDFIKEYPEEIADMLADDGYDADSLMDRIWGVPTSHARSG